MHGYGLAGLHSVHVYMRYYTLALNFGNTFPEREREREKLSPRLTRAVVLKLKCITQY